MEKIFAQTKKEKLKENNEKRALFVNSSLNWSSVQLILIKDKKRNFTKTKTIIKNYIINSIGNQNWLHATKNTKK